MREIDSIAFLVDEAKSRNQRISDVILEIESIHMEKTPEELILNMTRHFEVMRDSVNKGLDRNLKSASGLVGGGAWKLYEAMQNKRVPDDIIHKAMVKAIAAAEYNACMGKIVAAPTGGSCGIIPAVLIAAMEHYNLDLDTVVRALITAGGIGIVIAKNASLSGAEGGCMAECGSAAGMAAAAYVELMNGTPDMVASAVSIALENSMGLVCDPVAGLVEIPCVNRNASGAANAILSANMALAGITSFIPADEVIKAMDEVGKMMPQAIKETAEGGIAATPTARTVKLKSLSI